MQYRSLTELQNKTKGAFKDNLRQGLTFVERRMEQRLEEVAAQTFNPIDSINLSSPEAAEEIDRYFADVKRSHPEIKEIFAFAFSDAKGTNNYAYMYSDKFVKTTQTGFTHAQSNILTLFDNARMTQSFLDDNRKYLFLDHSCPTCPPTMGQGAYLFYPLKDLTRGGQSGFAGVLFNEGFVSDDLIAGSISKTSNTYHGNTATLDVVCTIRDENQRVLYSNAAAQDRYFLEIDFSRVKPS